MKMICMAVMLFITLLSAGAQKNIPASDIKVAMMKATRFMVEKVSNRGGYLWIIRNDMLINGLIH